jgi:hypothetical protein
MSVNYRYLAEQKLILVCYWGEVSIAQAMAARAARAADPALRDARAVLIDGGNIEVTPITGQQATALVDLAVRQGDDVTRLPTAVVVANDLTYGLARMLESLFTVRLGRQTVQAFRKRADAAAWLEADLAQIEKAGAEIRAGPSLV